ncbi:nucleotidyltransferase family protein [Mumia qirimensis]|uniref:nucleotidyltransferase family protein n=1 Tax=Mumia qirimensis TaxID=3234852 RepID=UPI00351D73F4
MTDRANVTGVLLAAGAGRRMGMPKALVKDTGGEPWVRRGVRVLRDGGCDPVMVLVGAEPERVTEALGILRPAPEVVPAVHWEQGMGASLRAALAHLGAASGADAAVVALVDLPDVGPDVVRRMLEQADAAADRAAVLARATYDGRPGHPVLIGRDHWAAMAATLSGDEGGRRYLADHGALAVECGDLATGRDQDTPSPPPQ